MFKPKHKVQNEQDDLISVENSNKTTARKEIPENSHSKPDIIKHRLNQNTVERCGDKMRILSEMINKD